MFARLRAMLRDPGGDAAASVFGEDDSRTAAAALMVHLLAIDGHVASKERAAMTTALMREYGLSEAETADLIDEAHRRDVEAVDLYAFTSVLKRALDEDGRRRVIAMLWEMAFADGQVHEFEENMLWRVAELIGVSSRERMFLRREAARDAGQGQGEG